MITYSRTTNTELLVSYDLSLFKFSNIILFWKTEVDLRVTTHKNVYTFAYNSIKTIVHVYLLGWIHVT